MLGLGDYGSSSEDEDKSKQTTPPKPAVIDIASSSDKRKYGNDTEGPILQPVDSSTEHLQDKPTENSDITEPLVGPLPPTGHNSHTTEEPSQSRQLSPFTSTRSLIRDMTLPPLPNLDIPPSPPGSPDPEANKKFAHFLALKKNGVHFNEKLGSSSSLKNPSLLRTLMEHAGIDEKTQYSTSLPSEIWDPSTLPSWGYKDELQKSQQEIRRKIEEKRAAGQRDTIDFVSGSGEPSRSTTPMSGKMKSSAAERVMAGIGREHSKSPHKPDQSRRSDYERRPKRTELEYRRQRSRSPGRRRRSRSR